MKSDKSSKCMQTNLRTQHLTININKQQLKGHKLKQYKPTLRIVHKCTRTQFLHAPWQARRLGPNSLARDAHFWRAVLVLPNMEVDSVAREIEPSRDTHGYWPQRGFTVSKGRTFESSCKHLPARQRHITITPTRTHSCRSGSEDAPNKWGQVRQTCCTNNIRQTGAVMIIQRRDDWVAITK